MNKDQLSALINNAEKSALEVAAAIKTLDEKTASELLESNYSGDGFLKGFIAVNKVALRRNGSKTGKSGSQDRINKKSINLLFADEVKSGKNYNLDVNIRFDGSAKSSWPIDNSKTRNQDEEVM